MSQDHALRLFIGYDSPQPVAFHVLVHSILARSSRPVSIIPLVQEQLRRAGLYTRERNSLESTEHSFTRFLVPHLSDYQGYSVFMDSDILCRTDIQELYGEIALQLCETPESYKSREPTQRKRALLCCQHDYTPQEGTKFLGHQQTAYPRKNWSSVMVFANDQCRALTPEYVSRASGLELHRFQWLPDSQIGALPLEWNWLVGEYPPALDAKLVHFTAGGPWLWGFGDVDYAEEWTRERLAAGLTCQPVTVS